MKIAIIGGTCSGRRTLAMALEHEGLPVARFLTDTDPEPDEHMMDPRKLDESYPTTERLLVSQKPDGGTRFTTTQELAKTVVAVIGPNQLEELCLLFPKESIHVVLVGHETETATRKQRELAEMVAEKAYLDGEGILLDGFRESLKGKKPIAPNQILTYMYWNDYGDGTPMGYAKMVWHSKKLHENLCVVLEQCVSLGILDSDGKEGIISVREREGKYVTESQPVEVFADEVISDDEGMSGIMGNWLAKMDREYVRHALPSREPSAYFYKITMADGTSGLIKTEKEPDEMDKQTALYMLTESNPWFRGSSVKCVKSLEEAGFMTAVREYGAACLTERTESPYGTYYKPSERIVRNGQKERND